MGSQCAKQYDSKRRIAMERRINEIHIHEIQRKMSEKHFLKSIDFSRSMPDLNVHAEIDKEIDIIIIPIFRHGTHSCLTK